MRAALRSYLRERQRLLLWRDTYDRMRSLASDGRVHALELGVALEQIVLSRGAAGGAEPGYGAGMGAEPGYGAEPGCGFS